MNFIQMINKIITNVAGCEVVILNECVYDVSSVIMSWTVGVD